MFTVLKKGESRGTNLKRVSGVRSGDAAVAAAGGIDGHARGLAETAAVATDGRDALRSNRQ